MLQARSTALAQAHSSTALAQAQAHSSSLVAATQALHAHEHAFHTASLTPGATSRAELTRSPFPSRFCILWQQAFQMGASATEAGVEEGQQRRLPRRRVSQLQGCGVEGESAQEAKFAITKGSKVPSPKSCVTDPLIQLSLPPFSS